jgi:hypothetical protein
MDTIKAILSPKERLTSRGRQTFENQEELAKHLQFQRNIDETREPFSIRDEKDEEEEDETPVETPDSDQGIWSRIFRKSLTQGEFRKELPNFTKFENNFRKHLKLDDPKQKRVQLETWYENISTALDLYCECDDTDMLYEVASHNEVKFNSLYSENNDVLFRVLKATIDKSTPAYSIVKGYKKNGIEALKSLIATADSSTFNSKMECVDDLLETEFTIETDLDQYFMDTGKILERLVRKRITIVDIYMAQVIRSFDNVPEYKAAMGSLLSIAHDDISEDDIRAHAITTRDQLKRANKLESKILANPNARRYNSPRPETPTTACNNCGGTKMHWADKCPDKGKTCEKCGKNNHTSAHCFSSFSK